MASTGIERQSSIAERLAILTARSKHIDGEGYGTTRADPMLLAGAMKGLSRLQEELIHAKLRGEAAARGKVFRMLWPSISTKYDIKPTEAMALATVAMRRVIDGVGCKGCGGTGVTVDQRDCLKCGGVGIAPVPDTERAEIAGVKYDRFVRTFSSMATEIENELRREEISALYLIQNNYKE